MEIFRRLVDRPTKTLELRVGLEQVNTKHTFVDRDLRGRSA